MTKPHMDLQGLPPLALASGPRNSTHPRRPLPFAHPLAPKLSSLARRALVRRAEWEVYYIRADDAVPRRAATAVAWVQNKSLPSSAKVRHSLACCRFAALSDFEELLARRCLHRGRSVNRFLSTANLPGTHSQIRRVALKGPVGQELLRCYAVREDRSPVQAEHDSHERTEDTSNIQRVCAAVSFLDKESLRVVPCPL